MGEPRRYFVNRLSDEGPPPPQQELADLQKERAETIVRTVLENFKKTPENADGGLYVGLAGVAYMLVHLARLPAFEGGAHPLLEEARRCLALPLDRADRNIRSGRVTDKTGFLTGNVGVYAVAAVVFNKLGVPREESSPFLRLLGEVSCVLAPLAWFDQGGDELFVGRAGFLCAVLWLRRELPGEMVITDAEVDALLNTMVESGRQMSRAVGSPSPLMYHYYKTQYLGPAHGLAGILFIMLCFPAWLERQPGHKDLVKGSIDFLVGLQAEGGNFPSAMDEVGPRRARHPDDELVHWCHGAPGTVFLLAKAYRVFRDERYLDAAVRCGEVTWRKGLLKKGPGLCHGVCGSGYVFLVLYRLTGDARHLRRATRFMDFIYSADFARGARQPDSPWSLYEGLAGAACFAGDLTDPSRAEFPFFGID